MKKIVKNNQRYRGISSTLAPLLAQLFQSFGDEPLLELFVLSSYPLPPRTRGFELGALASPIKIRTPQIFMISNSILKNPLKNIPIYFFIRSLQ